jgi:6-phospho 3-hexuloisomerase
MKQTQLAMNEIVSFLEDFPKKMKGKDVEKFINALMDAKRVFVVGAGRSGLVVKAFAMRLMHLDFNVHVVGETITPSLRRGDLIVALSGSGETDLIVESSNIAKKIGVKIVAITTYPKSNLARIADLTVVLPGRTKAAKTSTFMRRELAGEYASLTPLGTLFEIGAMVFLDGVIASLMVKLGRKEEDMRAKHATIE